MGRPMSRSERLARKTVEAVLGVEALFLEGEGEKRASHDFDLVYPDNRRPEPLEVTEHSDEAFLNTFARIEEERRLRGVNVALRWMVSVPPTHKARATDIREIKTILRTLIPRLETDGVNSFYPSQLAYADGPYEAEARALFELGVNTCHGSSPVSGREGSVELALSFGSFLNPTVIAEIAEAAASALDNRGKLNVPWAKRRHLAIVLTGATEDMATSTLRDCLLGESELPPMPKLPEEITTAWVMSPDGAMWITPPDDPWRRYNAGAGEAKAGEPT